MNILITGASRGLGLSLTKLSLKRGHVVVAGVRSSVPGDELNALKSEYADFIHMVNLDVADEASVKEAARVVEERLGYIDVLINNAGVLLGRSSTIEDLDLEDLQGSFDVNAFGPMCVTKHFVSLIRFGDQAAVLNISSESAFDLRATDLPYSLSKNALNMFTRKLRSHWADRKIRIYSIHPGWVRTDMGGENADLDPIESATGILDIAENKVRVADSDLVDYLGRPKV